jgi:hypothetical protein
VRTERPVLDSCVPRSLASAEVNVRDAGPVQIQYMGHCLAGMTALPMAKKPEKANWPTSHALAKSASSVLANACEFGIYRRYQGGSEAARDRTR